jgi:hypothetical protein
MEFIGLTLALLLVLVLILIGLGRAFQDHSVRELLDWKPTRSPEVEAQNEIDDVQQMIDAQNVLRRKRGAPEITEGDVQRQAMEDQRMRARGTGPFAQRDEVLDELDHAPARDRNKGKPAAKPKPKRKPKPKPQA